MRKLTVLFAVIALLIVGLVPAQADDHTDTIADIVVASATSDTPEFATLLAAVQAADPAVLDALSNPDAELTVFAPTDAAFAALAEALGEEAFGEILADTDALTGILLYHVLDGAVYSSDVVTLLEANDGMFSVQTLNGQYIDISTEMGNVYVDGAMLNLDMVDIEASNGVIHVIDAVIVPESKTIADVVVEAASDMDAPEFTLLLAAVQAADPSVLEALSDAEGSFTVFAPTDAAFKALGEDTLNAVLADPALLTNILFYHVVPGAVYSADVADLLVANDGMFDVEMANGSMATVEGSEMGITIGGANIIAVDIETGNGVIHVIDAVILPPTE
jgi:transforming growth factor-beta-induced protein